TNPGTDLGTSTSTETNKNTNKVTNKDTNTNNASKVPPTKGNDKKTALLPKTGGTPTELISMFVGMLLLVFGVILFRRQRG
ncbi:LPXTG cell wall anchor domain-containing protein, partial [Bacillus sp. JJ1127]|uniref:LPXTG cell wall anchor domain-containing protein n=1 Tax=Bacillus sp. JJ1127 TaxID=3122952 RepID=UPI0030007A29